VWQYVRLDTMYSATNGDIRFLAVKGTEIDASLQHNSTLYKDFVIYYASSRYGRIEELPTVHSILNLRFRYVGYQNCITKSSVAQVLL
jgi:SLT domain-containing protein